MGRAFKVYTPATDADREKLRDAFEDLSVELTGVKTGKYLTLLDKKGPEILDML